MKANRGIDESPHRGDGVLLAVRAELCAGCTQQAPASAKPTEIKVGVIASLTGPASNVGTNMWQSAQVAAAEINAKGGGSIGGVKHPIRAYSIDTREHEAGIPVLYLKR